MPSALSVIPAVMAVHDPLVVAAPLLVSSDGRREAGKRAGAMQHLLLDVLRGAFVGARATRSGHFHEGVTERAPD